MPHARTLKHHPRTRIAVLCCALVLAGCACARAQNRTVGVLLNDPRTFNGYTLFSPLMCDTTYLIDNDGRIVHVWRTEKEPGMSAYLTPEGHLLVSGMITTSGNPVFFAGGTAGVVQEYDWDGQLVWEYEHSSAEYCTHHDIELLPNGNVLIIAWELKSVLEAIVAGRDTNFDLVPLWPDKIIEVKKTGPTGGDIVWEWHAWDHLIQDFDPRMENYGTIAEHPERIDLNFIRGNKVDDLMHTNAIDYNEQLDQILLTVLNYSEVWVIDHSTTTAEAASHSGGRYGRGGDILYRWGNPSTYRVGSGTGQILYGIHDAQWIEKGLPGESDITVYNNGPLRPGPKYSSVEQFTPLINQDGTYPPPQGQPYGPPASNWVYTATPPTAMYSNHLSGAQRLPNGNTLICNGTYGEFLEVTPEKETVWRYISPVTFMGIFMQGETIPVSPAGSANIVFKVRKYPADFPGFMGKDLTPGDFVERYPTGTGDPARLPDRMELSQNHPNPCGGTTAYELILPRQATVDIALYDSRGKRIRDLLQGSLNAGHHHRAIDVSQLPNGIYFYRVCTVSSVLTRALTVMH